MLENNKEAFDNFRLLHDSYALNPKKLQTEFNHEGDKIMKIIREWEGKLCMQSEKGGYGSFTSNLAEKFQAEVRKHFPEIVNIGIIHQTPFSIKKIRL
jgi:hypothetical protein